MNLSYNTYLDRKTQILDKKMCHKMNPVMIILNIKEMKQQCTDPKS